MSGFGGLTGPGTESSAGGIPGESGRAGMGKPSGMGAQSGVFPLGGRGSNMPTRRPAESNSGGMSGMSSR
jgi:hypothetical protein